MSSVHEGSNEPVVQALHRLDLNLLVALDTLIRERSVTRAAHIAGVTQSAMSHTLRRLRDVFDDPLLVRGKGGMLLTPRAEELAVPVRSGLVTLGRALAEPGSFDPKTARRTFRVASPDLFDALVLPSLLQRLGASAPGVDLVIGPAEASLEDDLETGEVDVAVVPFLAGGVTDAPSRSGLLRKVLFKDSFSVFARKGHPALRKGAMPLKAFVAASHLLVSPAGQGKGLVDMQLEPMGLSRRIALRIRHFHTAPPVLASSDLILTAPTSLRLITDPDQVVCMPPPFDVPNHSLALVWHERFSDDPAQRWFREQVAAVAPAP